MSKTYAVATVIKTLEGSTLNEHLTLKIVRGQESRDPASLHGWEWLGESESPSKEGNKDREVDGLSLLKFISEIGWGSVGGGEFINHNNGRIIKEQTLLKEFNEWDNQQKEGMR